ncbi:coiled-coil domain-containing protein 180 [Haplochromis burtoni]|uniref:coiled-coil domain-containing protein 180 n=1 Tax=Haplochromis burtoni TaxID=8153 RepID=UPI0006C99403|nr:coiled-coil domain-containing protein 180 [Haplochromis burtoni]
MCESTAVPSGEVYRQLFDAQAQLSRSLLAGRRDTGTNCLSAVDSNTHCSTASSRRQQAEHNDDDDDVIDDVGRLPDAVVVDHPSSDIIERLTEKKIQKHQEALKQLDSDLSQLSQVCETQVKAISQELLSSLQEVDLRLDTLKVRMNQLEDLEDVSMQEIHGLWKEVEEDVKLKKSTIVELNLKLTETEKQRTDQIRAIIRKYYRVLEQISFLHPSDIHRLIHTEATMLNQSLLANRRSIARLLLLLQEENLHKESILRRHWEDCLSHWRRKRVHRIVDQFRGLCSRNEDQQLASVQQIKLTQQDLTERRRDIINKISSLVPPTCSKALVSDWFDQLTDVNQQTEHFHTELLHQLRCCFEQTWQNRLAEVERCKEVLSSLELSEEEVNDIINSQLLTVIGAQQSQDEEQLAALDVSSDSVARHAFSLSRSVFVVMRAAALLWETHCQRLERRDEKLQQDLNDLRCSQQQHLQKWKMQMDDLLGGLRQESSEDALKTSLDKTIGYLQQIKHSCNQFVIDQWTLLNLHPSCCLEELVSYSRNLSSFYHLSHTYQPSPGDLEKLVQPSSGRSSPYLETSWQIESPETSHSSQIWLIEAGSILKEIYDFSSSVTFTSSKDVVYSAPVFRCSIPNLPVNLEWETHLSLFPVDLLLDSLSRSRTLFLNHLEQHFHNVLSLAVSMMRDRKEAVRSEQELQLQQLSPRHIKTHIYEPRMAELQLHRQHVDTHFEGVLDLLTSCRMELQDLQASIKKKNMELMVTLSNIEANIQTASSSQHWEAASTTLQDCLHRHIKETQDWLTNFRQTVMIRMEEGKNKTAQLLSSFRLFSEGGDFAPQELKMFQRRVREETKRISTTEESIYSALEAFESRSLQKVKEVSAPLEEKLSFLKSEVKFIEDAQKMITSTQVHIKAEAARSNHQQTVISKRLEDLRKMLDDTQLSPDQVCSFLSSINKELRECCQYLDLSLDSALEESLALSGHHKSRKQVLLNLSPGLLQPNKTNMDPLDDPVVGIIRSLNRISCQDPAKERERRQRISSGLNPIQLQQRQDSVNAPSVKSRARFIRTDIRHERRFQIFGPEPDLSAQSFSSKVNLALWKANDILLQLAEDFYRSERLSCFQLLPDSLDQWIENTQQKLVGYHEQARRFLDTSRDDVVKQLSVFEELLLLSPAVLISHHERQHGAGLREEVARLTQKLEKTLAASEKEKSVNIGQLRTSLGEDELEMLNSREELRQQQLHSTISSAHLELQECVRGRGEEFVTSLASLTEKLLHQMNDLFSPAETGTATARQQTEGGAVTVEAASETGSRPSAENSTGDLPSSHTAVTTVSIATSKWTPGHVTVMEQRNTAMKRFEQVVKLELLLSDDMKRRQLSEQQSWNTHWRQQIDSLKLIQKPT